MIIAFPTLNLKSDEAPRVPVDPSGEVVAGRVQRRGRRSSSLRALDVQREIDVPSRCVAVGANLFVCLFDQSRSFVAG